MFAAIRWLARRPGADNDRIAIVGYSHGGGTVLSVLDRTERSVREQPAASFELIVYPGSYHGFDGYGPLKIRTGLPTATHRADTGHERFTRYLGLGHPKAFAVTEKGGSYLSADDATAMATAIEPCGKAGVKCWLYAVDDTVVWKTDPRERIDASRLQRKPGE